MLNQWWAQATSTAAESGVKTQNIVASTDDMTDALTWYHLLSAESNIALLSSLVVRIAAVAAAAASAPLFALPCP